MIDFFIISLFASLGLSILVTQKGNEWPIKKPRILFQKYIRKINTKLSKMFFCVVCFSFWSSLIIDTLLFVYAYSIYDQYYFLWPISGFASSGLSYIIFETIDSLSSQPTININ